MLLAIGAVIYIIKVMSRLSSIAVADKALPRRGVMGEVFPTVEILEPEPVVPVQQKKKKPSAAKPKAQPKTTARTAEKAPETAAAAPARENDYAIKNKSDAKRAIIYSEIFGKKYF